MEYVKKQAFGGIRTCDKDEATHVLQTVADYSEMIEIASMYRDLSRTAEKREKKLKEKYTGLQSNNKDLRDEIDSLQRQIAIASQASKQAAVLKKENVELMTHIKELEAEVEQERNLNQNLLRISRERANADRKISPKKKHDGYLVVQTREWRERTPDRHFVRTWKSVLQSPYDASISPDAVEPKIFKDLIDNVLTDIGCNHYVAPEDNGVYTNEEDGSVMYCWRFSADYKSGYWCVIIYTTRPLIVPVERRCRNVREKKNKK